MSSETGYIDHSPAAKHEGELSGGNHFINTNLEQGFYGKILEKVVTIDNKLF